MYKVVVLLIIVLFYSCGPNAEDEDNAVMQIKKQMQAEQNRIAKQGKYDVTVHSVNGDVIMTGRCNRYTDSNNVYKLYTKEDSLESVIVLSPQWTILFDDKSKQ